jgi:hypothetical protein
MNKAVVFCMAVMAAFVGFCGYLAYNYHGDPMQHLIGPNCMYKVQEPPISGEDLLMRQAVEIAARTDDANLKVNGHRIVASRMPNPERHDMSTYMERQKMLVEQKRSE